VQSQDRAGIADDDLPRISVVTPSYNQSAFLERTIRSVLDQQYPNLEYLVLDGGSTDGSVEILERYGSRLSFWSSGKDDGQASAVNAGWRRASGDVLGWVNSDDYYLPGTLAFVGEYFRAHPDVTMLYGAAQLVDERGHVAGRMGGPFDMARALKGDYMIPQPTAFIRRRAIDQVGLLDESLYYSLDLDLFLRLAQVARPTYVDRLLAGCTVHAAAKMQKGRAAARQERFRVSRRYARGRTRWMIPILSLRSRVHHLLPRSLRARLDHWRGIHASDPE
jgi:glycosyltransferase involved in cell wall biosynthesis